MELLDLLKARYSVRSFKDCEIEKETLEKILEAGRVAPTACNNQPQVVYIAKSLEAREKLASVCRCTFGAPVIMVVCYDVNKSWKNKLTPGYQSGETDAAIVCTHMMLEAFEQGVGSCWVAYFDSETVKKALSLPDNLVVSALLPMGYPADGFEPNPLHFSKKSMNETVKEI